MVNRLLLLNGLSIVNVLLFHATGFGFTAMFSWAHRYRPVTSPNYDAVGSASYWVMRLIEQYAVFTIPAFLFVSGFFVSVLAGRSRSGITASSVLARIRALAPPYLFWSGVILIALALEGRIFSGARYLRMLLTGSSSPSNYYVPLLMQLYLLAPLLVWAARRQWRALLLVTGALQLGVYLLQYVVVLGVEHPVLTPLAAALPKWLFAAQLFWFTLGVVVGFEQQVFKAAIHRLRWHLLAAAAVLFVAGVVEWELLFAASGQPWVENRVTPIDGLYAAAVILAFIAFPDVRVPFSSAFTSLASKSFGIYLVHGIVMEYSSRAIYHLAPWMLATQAIFLPLVVGFGLGVPLALMELLRRSRARAVYPYVFG
ncbi:MAG: acyltransferase family protein [Vicinamibacterales bacterium]